jgi:L-aspartate oxidase
LTIEILSPKIRKKILFQNMNTAFLIIGSGIAGMMTALRVSELGKVVLISKKSLISGSTALAQGGVAGPTTSPNIITGHLEDTLRVGGNINNKQAVHTLVEKAESAVHTLKKYGVIFDNTLHTEAGHKEPRVWHIADKTGLAIASVLSQKIRESQEITVLENTFVSDLLVRENAVYGAEVMQEGKTERIYAHKTILATGGAGQIYAETTNPVEASGDGFVMAARAGAKLKDMEFVQFHPTALATESSPLFLLSEALRGEGAMVVNTKGIQICDPLLPRDELSRIIFEYEKKEPVFLSLKHRGNGYWREHFPTIFQKLEEYNVSPEVDFIPIVPAAHFFCGGIETDIYGRTNVRNLSAVGEVACTGVHGSNRLASNSLLEALVFAEQTAKDVMEQMEKKQEKPGGHFETVSFAEDTEKDQKIRKEIQRICWKYLGIIRKEKGLDRATTLLQKLSPTGTETKNLLAVATFVTEAAKKRKKSIGCHFIASK